MLNRSWRVDPNLSDALQRALQGDTSAMTEISRADHASLRNAEEAIGQPLIVTRAATVRVLRALIDDRFPPTVAQAWASFIRWGFVGAFLRRGPITPIDIDYEEAWEDAIATAISRMDELGDLIDGEISRHEGLEILQLLGEP
jgi:hypothetical protein